MQLEPGPPASLSLLFNFIFNLNFLNLNSL